MSRFSRLFVTASLMVLAVVVTAALAACGSGGAGSTASPSATSDPVVLHVNGRPLRQSAVDAVRAEFRLGGSKDTLARAEREVVRRELVREQAARLGITADPADVTARRNEMVQQVGGEQALAADLKQVPMTEAQLRSDLGDGVLRQAVENEMFKSLSATPAEARAYYDAHRASFRQEGSVHLWSIQVPARAIAETALGRLHSGYPFEQVARQFSTDPQVRDAGGDNGVVALVSLPAPLLKAVQTARPGVPTQPVQGPGGWYVLKITDLKRARALAFPQVEQEVRNALTQQQRFNAMERWLDKARTKAKVTRP